MSRTATDSDDDRRFCADLARRHDYDRYLTALVAEPDRRAHLLALYAFNHEIAKTRESVSEPMAGAIRLQWWSEAVDEFARGAVRAHPVARSLAHAVDRFALPAEELEGVIEARRVDLDDRRFDDLEALTDYARRTGGAVQMLAMRICATDDPALLNAAGQVGTAWALTGIIRAISFQAAMHRLQLPSEELAAAGIREGQIFRGEFPPELRDVVARIARRAGSHLDAARPVGARAGRRFLPALLPGGLARHYLVRLKRADYVIENFDSAGGQLRRLLRVGIGYTTGKPGL